MPTNQDLVGLHLSGAEASDERPGNLPDGLVIVAVLRPIVPEMGQALLEPVEQAGLLPRQLPNGLEQQMLDREFALPGLGDLIGIARLGHADETRPSAGANTLRRAARCPDSVRRPAGGRRRSFHIRQQDHHKTARRSGVPGGLLRRQNGSTSARASGGHRIGDDRDSPDYPAKKKRSAPLGDTLARVAVEAAVQMSWDRYLGLQGRFVGMHGFGESGKIADVYKKFDITAEAVVRAARDSLQAAPRA